MRSLSATRPRAVAASRSPVRGRSPSRAGDRPLVGARSERRLWRGRALSGRPTRACSSTRRQQVRAPPPPSTAATLSAALLLRSLVIATLSAAIAPAALAARARDRQRSPPFRGAARVARCAALDGGGIFAAARVRV